MTPVLAGALNALPLVDVAAQMVARTAHAMLEAGM